MFDWQELEAAAAVGHQSQSHLCQLEALWTLSSDLCHPQDFFTQRTANQLIFNLLTAIFR